MFIFPFVLTNFQLNLSILLLRSVLGNIPFEYVTNMYHHNDGTPAIHGTTKDRCRSDGGKDDSNHDNVQTDQVKDGRICLS